ncbi:hypothetical protein [Saccharothrix sp. HUAS TT10]
MTWPREAHRPAGRRVGRGRRYRPGTASPTLACSGAVREGSPAAGVTR